MKNSAVLIIHGFAGGTYDEEAIFDYLALEGYHTFNFTLPGHEKMLFNKITRNDWINSCKEHLEMLINNGYKNIYVLGHSMGGVLACILASEYKEVTKLVLAAPAFKYLTFEEENFKFLTALKNSPKLFEDYKKQEVVSRVLQFPVSVIKEFMALIEENYNTPKTINIPTLIIQGKHDIIVPIKSAEYVYDSINTEKKKLVLLENVTHDIFRSQKVNETCVLIDNFFKEDKYD